MMFLQSKQNFLNFPLFAIFTNYDYGRRNAGNAGPQAVANLVREATFSMRCRKAN